MCSIVSSPYSFQLHTVWSWQKTSSFLLLCREPITVLTFSWLPFNHDLWVGCAGLGFLLLALPDCTKQQTKLKSNDCHFFNAIQLMPLKSAFVNLWLLSLYRVSASWFSLEAKLKILPNCARRHWANGQMISGQSGLSCKRIKRTF